MVKLELNSIMKDGLNDVFLPEILLVYHSMIQRIIDVVHSERVPLKKIQQLSPQLSWKYKKSGLERVMW